MRRSIIPGLVLAYVTLALPAVAVETVTVNAGQVQGPMPMSALGFLHGIDEDGHLGHDAVATLDPAHWRLYKHVNYVFATQHSASITYSLCDRYAWDHGGFPNARPWDDWAGWESYVAQTLDYLHLYFPGNLPAFYDIWNEPDHPYFWTGTYDQLLELFARTVNVVRNYDPEAKLVGPSISRFLPGNPGVAGVLGFLEDLDTQYGVRLDAIAWHENDSGNYGGYMPEEIPAHANLIRGGITTLFGPGYQPELHINEYAGARVHLSPGWNVAYLRYIIDAQVDAAMRACWDVYSTPPYAYWSDCWDGLDGMFMKDGTTPTHACWVYRHYADMAGSQRVTAVSTSARTTVLAARDDAAETLRILVGRHWQGGPGDVSLRVLGYPYDHATVRIEGGRIPHDAGFFADPPRILPLPDGPVDLFSLERVVEAGSFTLDLSAFPSNEAFVLTVTGESPTAVTEPPETFLQLERPEPNPFRARTTLRFRLTREADTSLAVFDLSGRRVATLWDGPLSAGEHCVAWDGSDGHGRRAASGVYLALLEAAGEKATVRLALLE